MPDLRHIACCPRCRSPLDFDARPVRCANPACEFARSGFPSDCDQPVLIDFQESVFTRAAFEDRSGSVIADRDDSGRSWRTRLWALLTGENRVAPAKCREMLQIVKTHAPWVAILVIGGGAIGAGAEALYLDSAVQIIGTDVYASRNTNLVADAHRLPFRDAIFDGVWIQAVLEHVLEPAQVASEIYRVLKPDGLVYADTPFLQAVHEGAYDFTRFTQSGHRWLFRHFEQIDAGVVLGAGSSLIWALRYFFRALGMPGRIATLLALPFFWLRYLDYFARGRPNADAASGLFFFGRKTEGCLTPHDIVAYYQAQDSRAAGGRRRRPI